MQPNPNPSAAPPILLALLVVAGLAASSQAAPSDAPQLDWAKATLEPIVTGLNGSTTFSVAPDGAIWFTEVYQGNVSRFDPATGKTEIRHKVNSVKAGDERGLLGHALHPDFATNGVFYLYYTEPTKNASTGLNKIVRVERGQEKVLATLPGAVEHNGGQMLIAPDRTLFVSTGDNQQRWPAQDPKSLLGKVLRMTLDGKPVAGNLDGIVFSKGHRNVYGLAFDEEGNQLWATENSGWRRDEINKVQARGNYGYPECEGNGLNGVNTPCPQNKGYIPPVMTFYENRTAAPVGATFWNGALYWSAMKERTIHKLWNEGGKWKDEVVYTTESPVMDLQPSADGEDLLVSTWDGIWRVDFEGVVHQNPHQPPMGAARAAGLGVFGFVGAVALGLILWRRTA